MIPSLREKKGSIVLFNIEEVQIQSAADDLVIRCPSSS